MADGLMRSITDGASLFAGSIVLSMHLHILVVFIKRRRHYGLPMAEFSRCSVQWTSASSQRLTGKRLVKFNARYIIIHNTPE